LEIIVFKAADRFDADGVLTDLVTIEGVLRAMELLKTRGRA
jgi:hypothetical protein